SPRISWQIYEDRAIIMNHSDFTDIALNRDGGLVLKKIATGADSFSREELSFIKELEKLHIVVSANSPENESKNPESQRIEKTSVKYDVFESIKKYTSDKIIPLTAIIELTYRCDMKCPHCYIGEDRTNPVHLSLSRIKKFLHEFRKSGGLYVVFTGGDPLLHPDFPEIFYECRKLYLAVTILSTAQNFDKKFFGKMAENGLFSFQISFHGMETAHDNFTGKKGAFKKSIRCLEFLRDKGVFAQAALNIHSESIQDFKDMVNFFSDRNLPFVFNYTFYPDRKGNRKPEKINISKKQLEDCLKFNKPQLIPRFAEKKPEDPPCDAARNLLSLSPEGDVYPCLEIRKPAGNIKKESFPFIWKNSPVLKQIRQIKTADISACTNCDLKRYCNRCSGRALNIDGKLTGISSYDCKYAEALKSCDNSGI
ncbi:MAG: radical SAM protein, partial [bacterium]